MSQNALHILQTEAVDDRFRVPLMSFFLRRVGSRAEAEDLTQQVFLRLLTARRLEEVQDPHAFVFRVATNLLRDQLRTSYRRSNHIGLDTHEFENEHVEELTPERILMGQDSVRDTLRQLDGAGQRTKEMFLLWRVAGMTQREVADWFGCSQRNVERHILKATMHLMVSQTR